MRFPILKTKPWLPCTPTCSQCSKKVDNNRKAIFMGGALRWTDKKNDCAEMIEDGAGFLTMMWHGDENDPVFCSTSVDIARHTDNGQFEFYFCSTSCLRAFLNVCVDELEKAKERAFKREIARHMKKAAKKLRDPKRLKQMKKF